MIGWLEAIALAVFGAGLLGGVHCVAMCGSIVGLACGAGCSSRRDPRRWRLALAYNAGRITSYCIGGLLAGAVGQAGVGLRGGIPAQQLAMLASGIMLCVIALYLAGMTPVVRGIEAAGSVVWRRVQPWSRQFLPADTFGRAYSLGLAWGWLPCGMVYAMLLTALATGSAGEGALIMFAFGLGTLPNVLLIAVFFDRIGAALKSRNARLIAGALIAGVGLFSIAQSFQPAAWAHAGIICQWIPGLAGK